MSERKYSRFALEAREQWVNDTENENIDLRAENEALRREVDRLRAEATEKPKRGRRRKTDKRVRDFDERFAKLDDKDKSSVNAMMRVIKAIMEGQPTMFCLEAQFKDKDGDISGVEAFDVCDGQSPLIYEMVGRLQSMVVRLIDQADEERQSEQEGSVVKVVEAPGKYNEPQDGCNCPRCRMLRRMQEARKGPFDPKNVN